MAKLNQRLIYLLLFLLPWQTRLLLRPGSLNSAVWPAMRSFSEAWEYGHLGIFATEILLWLIVIVAVFKRKISWQFSLKKILWSSAGFLLIGYYFFVSPDRLLTFQTLAHYAAAAALFWLLKILGTAEKRLAILSFVLGVTLQAALGIGQFLTQSTFGNRWLGLVAHPSWLPGAAVLENSAGRWLRAYGGLPHPNILAGYLVISLILNIFLLSNIVKSDFTRQGWRLLLWCAYLLQIAALFFTFSRSAWLGLAVALIILVWRQKQKQLAISALLVFVFFGLLFYPLVTSRITATDRLEVASKNERLSQYGEAWSLVKQAPLFGTGPGFYTLARHNLQPDKPVWAVQPIHNIFVLALAEWGIIGLIIFLFTMGIFVSAKFTKMPIVVVLVILGLLDHYLLSLWSGNLLLVVILGLIVQGLDSN